MSTPPRTDAQHLEVLALIRDHGSVSRAADAERVPRPTMQARWDRAKRWAAEAGLPIPPLTNTPPAAPIAEVPALPDERPTVDELLERRRKEFDRKHEAKEARKLVTVPVRVDGPFGVALFGDPHVDDAGTDIRLLESHMQIVKRTPALLAGNVGDYSNNWVGRLARLYAEQSTTAAEAWLLVEWMVHYLPWLFLIGGNHDLWSGAGDPVQWMARSARVAYEAHGMRLGLQAPNGRVIRLNCRHHWKGHSMWNPAHGPAKAVQRGHRDHLVVAGHLHVSGYNILRDPQSGLISHALRVGSYKIHDRYAEEQGLDTEQISPAVVVVVQPDASDDSPRLLTIFHDVETGADFLTFLRSKKSTRAA
jgi:hypothetical protein